MARVVLTDDAKDDLKDFDRSTQILLLRSLKKLETEPEKRGQPLGSRDTSNLTGLRKLVVGNRDYRIVYRVEIDGTVCVVWVLGRRADAEVYQIAKSRIALNNNSPFAKELADMAALVFDPEKPARDQL